MSRPKKNQPLIPDADAPTVDMVVELRKRAIDMHADPFGDRWEFPGLWFFPQSLEMTHEDNDNAARQLVANLIRSTPEEFDRITKTILKMKLNFAANPTRQSYLLTACADFIEQAGFVPAKSELKKYILARLETYKDTPSPDDKAGWNRLFKQALLHRLEPIPGRPPIDGPKAINELRCLRYTDENGEKFERDLDSNCNPVGPYHLLDEEGNRTGETKPE